MKNFHWVFLFLLILTNPTWANQAQAYQNNQQPVAVVTPSAYFADIDHERISVDQCYDPDGDSISYRWRQINGPNINYSNKNGDLILSSVFQTGELQTFTFELVVNDGKLDSIPATTKVIVVPDFGDQDLVPWFGSFDPEKPSILAFGSGNCTYSTAMILAYNPWFKKANYFTLNKCLPPYSRLADSVIRNLYRYAPDYHQPIQTIGFSSGGEPAFEIAQRLNLLYGDSRYMVNRVTLLDAICSGGPTDSDFIELKQTVIDGETCWIENYSNSLPTQDVDQYFRNIPPYGFHTQIVSNDPIKGHPGVYYWYRDSHLPESWAQGFYNNGLTGGYYLSVAGPAKNLTIPIDSPTYLSYRLPNDNHTYTHNDANSPRYLPEPITLLGPMQVIEQIIDNETQAVHEQTSIVLTCEPSQYVVKYQLLIGAHPHGIAHYDLIAETNEPPLVALDSNTLPYAPTWATIRGRNVFGATIYADPVQLDIARWPIEILASGYRYHTIQAALDHAVPGDILVLDQGIYDEVLDNLDKDVTLQSTQPGNTSTVNNTRLTEASIKDFNGTLSGITIIP